MPKIAIVTDSTAYIPKESIVNLPVYTIPLHVIWGKEVFLDGKTIMPSEFYKKLQTAEVMPTTSQPSPAAFAEVYSELLGQEYEIISIHISSRLSGTIDSATQAKTQFPGAPIEIVDSLSTSMAMGFHVLSVADAIKTGADLKTCKLIAEQARETTGALFIPITLEFLRRGGRIGGAAAFLGTALDLKPLLELREGVIQPIQRIRTMTKALSRLLEVLQERIGSRTPVRLAGISANNEPGARQLLERAVGLYDPATVKNQVVVDASPTIGTHTGPGMLGVAYMAGM
jgi:DegV family protein with EDD domain